jgi:hypothetical protein
MGFTNYTALDIFTADDADELMRQSVMRFASTAARDSALSGNLEEGMMACTTDSDIFWIYSGGAWKPWWSPPIAFTSFVSGFIVIGNGTFSGSYQYTPSGLRVKWELLFGTTSDIAADAIWTLPTGSFADQGTSRALGTATLIAPTCALSGRSRPRPTCMCCMAGRVTPAWSTPPTRLRSTRRTTS